MNAEQLTYKTMLRKRTLSATGHCCVAGQVGHSSATVQPPKQQVTAHGRVSVVVGVIPTPFQIAGKPRSPPPPSPTGPPPATHPKGKKGQKDSSGTFHADPITPEAPPPSPEGGCSGLTPSPTPSKMGTLSRWHRERDPHLTPAPFTPNLTSGPPSPPFPPQKASTYVPPEVPTGTHTPP